MTKYTYKAMINDAGSCYGYHYFPSEDGDITEQEVKALWEEYQERSSGDAWNQLIVDLQPLIS